MAPDLRHRGQAARRSDDRKRDAGVEKTAVLSKNAQVADSSWVSDIQGTPLWIAVSLFLFLLPLTVHLIEGRETLQSASSTWPASQFTAESARRAHQHVTFLESLGVHMTGSVENEEKAVNYLVNELSQIRDHAQKDIQIEIGIQRPTGAFNIRFLDGMTLAYQNISNVVCRISNASSPTSTEEAILLNAHFDSMIGSLAAADDGSQVGILLELARLLASGTIALPRAVVILLNGAEESICQAAHGFIKGDAPLLLQPESLRPATPPDWRPSLRASIVLEAMGSGGREMLVRTTPNAPWLSRLYRDNVHVPRANVISDEIFRTGVFPGETDLFVFRDYAGLPGIDLLFVEDGYSYHSLQDTAGRVRPGDLQRCGGHALAMLDAMLRAPELSPSHRPAAEEAQGDPVYFDVLGLFLVWYSAAAAKAIHFGTAAAGLLYWALSPQRLAQLFGSLLTLVGFVLGAAAVGVLAYNLNPLSWYSDSRVALLMFIPGALSGGFLLKASSTLDTRGCLAGTVGWMALVLLALAALGVRSGYMFVVALLPLLLAEALAALLRLRGALRGALVLAGTAPGLIYWSQVLRTMLLIFLPVMGRAGMFLPADAFIALIAGLFAGLAASLPLALLSSAAAIRNAALLAALAAASALAASTTCFPYSLERPKRLFVQHAQRVYHDSSGAEVGSDAGLWINGFDARRNDDLRTLGVEEWREAESMACFWLHCNNPFYLPLPREFSLGWIIPAPAPAFPPSRVMSVAVRRGDSPADAASSSLPEQHLRRVWVSARGPSHMALVFKDERRRVEAWSLAEEVGKDGWRRGSEGTVFTFFSAASAGPLVTWDFWLDIRGPELFNASVHSHYLDFSETDDQKGCSVTPEMAKLQERLPTWMCPTCWRSVLHALVL